ncbi:MAG: PhoH family protein, partial [Verrucomicrobiota bacterium]
MDTLTLEYENARIAQSLYGGDTKLLRELESRLGVRTTARDGWIRLEGEKPALDRARAVFDQLHAAVKQGIAIQRHEFQQALDSVSSDGTPAEPLSSLLETKIHCSPRKPPVVPRTAGQKAYVHAIQNHDITFGIGPAGTGKTYLAVACAVAALKQEKIKRIVLTRPAGSRGPRRLRRPG